MALHKERGEQTRRKWLSRLVRERRGLSASVEATLVDDMSGEQHDETEEQAPAHHVTQKSGLIPPRVNLQSRQMPVVRVEGLVESSVLSLPADHAVEQQLASTMQNTGVLRRIAQRITTSFAVLGSSVSSDGFPMLPPPTSGEARELSRMHEASLLPPAIGVEEGRTNERVDLPLVSVLSEMPPASSVVEASPPLAQNKHRLAGRTTKIRLETAPMPQVKPDAVEQNAHALLLRGEKGETVARDGADMWHEKRNTTSAHLAAIDRFDGEIATAAQGVLSGSGVFESGQRDMTIANRHITTASVILVMLTSNPGPVVVQYVSLQPQVGFTIHLTAPTMARATFNYVILQGELF